MYDKEYVMPDDLDSVLTVRERAERHLRTWNRRQLIQQLLNASKLGWLEKWAEEYDESQAGRKPT